METDKKTEFVNYYLQEYFESHAFIALPTQYFNDLCQVLRNIIIIENIDQYRALEKFRDQMQSEAKRLNELEEEGEKHHEQRQQVNRTKCECRTRTP